MIVGKVQRVKEKTTSYGVMYDIQVQDQWYGCGKKHPGCNEGDMVKFNTRQNGNFTNVQGAVTVMEEATQSQQTGGQSAQPSGPNTQQRIEYQNSRNVAVALLPHLIGAMGDLAKPASAEEVLALLRDTTNVLFEDTLRLDEILANIEGE